MGVPTLGHVKYTGGGGTSPSAHASYTGLTADDHPQYATPSRQRSYGYTTGGFVIAIVEKYDDVIDSWSIKHNLSVARYNPADFYLNGFGYCCGGNDGNITLITEKYDDVTDIWTSKDTLNIGRDMPTGFSLNGFGYVVGGWTTGFTGATEKYDDVADSWTVKTSMGDAREESTSFYLNGYGYIIGGLIGVGISTSITERYDDIANSWSYKDGINTDRSDMAGFSLNGYGYATGGLSSDTGPLLVTERYDNITNVWTTKDNLDTARYALVGFSLNGYGYTSGGWTTDTTSATEKYDDIADSWTTKTGLVTDTYYVTGFSQGQLTEQKYLSPEIVNILRSVSYRAVIVGSYNTSATSSGICNITHSLGTVPVIAWAFPICTPTTVGQVTVDLKGIGGTYISFVAASCPLNTAAATTSSITLNFVWGAQP